MFMCVTFKKICRLAGNAVVDYGMIEEGDRILVGVSGGKDSLVLLKVLKHLSNAAPDSPDFPPMKQPPSAVRSAFRITGCAWIFRVFWKRKA